MNKARSGRGVVDVRPAAAAPNVRSRADPRTSIHVAHRPTAPGASPLTCATIDRHGCGSSSLQKKIKRIDCRPLKVVHYHMRQYMRIDQPQHPMYKRTPHWCW